MAEPLTPERLVEIRQFVEQHQQDARVIINPDDLADLLAAHDAMTEQVAALRAEYADLCIAPNSNGYWTCEACGATTPEVSPKHNEGCLIADTAVAAESFKRQQHIMGARDVLRRWREWRDSPRWTEGANDILRTILAQMELEREASA